MEPTDLTGAAPVTAAIMTNIDDAKHTIAGFSPGTVTCDRSVPAQRAEAAKTGRKITNEELNPAE